MKKLFFVMLLTACSALTISCTEESVTPTQSESDEGSGGGEGGVDDKGKI